MVANEPILLVFTTLRRSLMIISKRCSAIKLNSKIPTIILVHHELNVPSKVM